MKKLRYKAGDKVLVNLGRDIPEFEATIIAYDTDTDDMLNWALTYPAKYRKKLVELQREEDEQNLLTEDLTLMIVEKFVMTSLKREDRFCPIVGVSKFTKSDYLWVREDSLKPASALEKQIAIMRQEIFATTPKKVKKKKIVKHATREEIEAMRKSLEKILAKAKL